MTPEERNSTKKAHFDLLDLIIKCRINEPIGKLGLTHIPELKLKAIKDLKFQTSMKSLKTDGIIGIMKKKKNEFIIDCLKSAEYMTTYKNSLIVETGWPSVQVVPIEIIGSFHYEMRRRNGTGKMVKLSKKEGDFLTFLLTGNNLNMKREEITTALETTGANVSNLKNVIRSKLVKIDFSKNEALGMLPPYK